MTSNHIPAALLHLQENDPILGGIIAQVGPYLLKPDRDRFSMLVRSILSQQISTKAARTIRIRFQEMLPEKKFTPEALALLTPEQYRSVGISSQKAGYLGDLSNRVLDGRLNLKQIGRYSDEEVIQQLVQVKGIGRWTAQMFLIFALHRLDVFPHDDLGIRAALRNLYSLDALPTSQQSLEIATPWRPYATVATWYCWRSLEIETDPTQGKEYPV